MQRNIHDDDDGGDDYADEDVDGQRQQSNVFQPPAIDNQWKMINNKNDDDHLESFLVDSIEVNPMTYL